MRVSNFLLWQIAYAEIWVTDTFWPDFRARHLLQAILEYPETRSAVRRPEAVARRDTPVTRVLSALALLVVVGGAAVACAARRSAGSGRLRGDLAFLELAAARRRAWARRVPRRRRLFLDGAGRALRRLARRCRCCPRWSRRCWSARGMVAVTTASPIAPASAASRSRCRGRSTSACRSARSSALAGRTVAKQRFCVVLTVVASDSIAVLRRAACSGARCLRPRISPKKTVEGAIGGFVGGAVAMAWLGGRVAAGDAARDAAAAGAALVDASASSATCSNRC